MNKFYKYVVASALILGFMGCEDDEQNVTDLVQETVETGAVLRTIDFTDELLLDIQPEQFVITLEEQDELEGGLLQEVNVFVTYTDNSDIAGNSSSFTTTEILLDNIPASEFSPGPFGLPRVTVTYSVDELLAAIGGSSTDQIYVDDTFRFREELVLTDGRVFSVDNAGGIITAGFFNSPFQHTMTVTGGINVSFREDGLNEINVADGQPNDGYQTILQVQEAVVDLWDQTELFISYVDNNDDGVDNSTEEVSLGTIDRSLFTLEALDEGDDLEPIEMAVATPIGFTLDELLTGINLTLADLSEDDEVIIRYSVRNFAGREISSLIEPFSIAIPVVSCPFAPIEDATTFGVGTYMLEVTSGVFPDFGATIDYTEGPVEIVATTGLNREIVDAPFLPEFGPFLTTIPFAFSCDVTITANHLVAGGLGCGGAFDMMGESIDGVTGSFDSTDDTTFTVSFTIFPGASTCPSVPYNSTITLTRI